MALLRTNMMKSGVMTAGSLSMTAEANESFLVRALYVEPAAAAGYLKLLVERRTVGLYRIYGFAGNHLFFRPDLAHLNLMEFLVDRNINAAIPVASGETFTIVRAGQTTDVAAIVYDRYDAGDIKAADPNGSKSGELTFIQYLTYNAKVIADGFVTLNSRLNPTEFPNFPIDAVVPAGQKIEILGIVGGAVSEGDATRNLGRSKYLKITKDGTVLHDDDLNGLIFEHASHTEDTTLYDATISVIGANSDSNIGRPLLFDRPIECVVGEEVNVAVYIDWTTGGADFAANQIDVGLILRVVKT